MKEKTVFFCTECGNETGKWFGQCPACGNWNTLVEAPAASPSKSRSGAVKAGGAVLKNRPKRISELESQDEIRFSTGTSKLFFLLYSKKPVSFPIVMPYLCNVNYLRIS